MWVLIEAQIILLPDYKKVVNFSETMQMSFFFFSFLEKLISSEIVFIERIAINTSIS